MFGTWLQQIWNLEWTVNSLLDSVTLTFVAPNIGIAVVLTQLSWVCSVNNYRVEEFIFWPFFFTVFRPTKSSKKYNIWTSLYMTNLFDNLQQIADQPVCRQTIADYIYNCVIHCIWYQPHELIISLGKRATTENDKWFGEVKVLMNNSTV